MEDHHSFSIQMAVTAADYSKALIALLFRDKLNTGAVLRREK